MNLIILIIGLMSLSSVMVIIVSNPIQALLWLIVSYIFSVVIFLILGIDFLSLLLLLVYIGAVAVLFLFVIMMLNIKIIELRESYLRYVPIGIFIFVFFFFFFISSIFFEIVTIRNFENGYTNWLFFIYFFNSIKLLAYIFYTQFIELFFILALLLFISMIGAIILIIGWYDSYNSLYELKKKYIIIDSNYASIF